MSVSRPALREERTSTCIDRYISVGRKGCEVNKKTGEGESGFALVLSLALMAFLVLLMLSFSTLLQVEIQASAAATRQAQARENAIMGLQMAMGQLQELAGPDQRVTARADILDTVHEDKRFWTGVWRSDNNSGPLGWLVSWPGDPADPANIPSVSDAFPGNATNLVELVGAGSSEESVRAAKVALGGASASAVAAGHYAYWIGDEGIKAKVNLTNEYRDDDIRSSTYRASLKTAQRSGGEQMPGLNFLETEDTDVRDALLERLTSAGQLDLVAGALGLSDAGQGIRSHFFDYTMNGEGVLANVRDGGLKIDLTRAMQKAENSIGPFGARIFNGGPYWRLLLDYYWNLRVDPNNPQISFRRRPFSFGGYLNSWAQEHGIMPIIVASELSMGLIYNYAAPVVQDRARFTVAPVLVLANPYNARINQARYIIRYPSYNSSGNMLTPQVRIQINGSDLKPGSNNYIHINQLLPPNANGHRGAGQNDLRFEINTSFEAGEIKIFTLGGIQEYLTLAHPVLAEGYNSDSYAWVRPDSGQNPQLVVPDAPSATLRMVSRALYRSIILHKKHDVSTGFADGNNLVHVQPYMAPFGTAPTTYLSDSTDKQVREFIWLKGSTSNESYTKNGPVYTLAHFNLRAPRHISFFQNTGHFASTYLYAARVDYGNNSNFDEFNLWEPDAIIETEDGIPRYSMPLFHLLRTGETWQSLAELQHIDFSPHSVAPSFAAGNSWAHPFIDPDKVIQSSTGGDGYGGTVTVEWVDMSWQLNNALWDNYFFSTLLNPAQILSPGSLSNPRMRPNLEELTSGIQSALGESSQAAAYFMVDGAFNVNSTSPEAWMAVLSGNQGMDIAYTDLKSGASGQDASYDGESGLAAILRSAFPMGELSVDEQGDFWRGFGGISNEVGSDGVSPSPLRRLAEEIVAEVRKRGPFRSLGEFVNRKPGTDRELALRGPLQAAIDRSGLNTTGRPEQRFGTTLASEPEWNFPEAVRADSALGQSGFRGKNAPGYITQADLLTAIGPFLSVRSDTFVIRAYGDVTNPLTGNTVQAKAWCEAIVQRVPEYVDPINPPWMKPNDPSLTGVNSRMGRRFEIIAFRWLAENEI